MTFGRAFARVITIVAFAVLPVVTLGAMLDVGLDANSLAVDFHHELYPQAKHLRGGENPYPTSTFETKVGGNYVWPPLAVAIISPLTLLPRGDADVVMALAGVAVFAFALWVVGLRDWRVYGACVLWPQEAGELRVSHLTPFVALLAAFAWRERERSKRSGVAVGLAIALKFFAWPIVVWLAARGRYASTAVAVVIGALSFASVIPFTGVADYGRALSQVGRHFDQDSYTVFGLFTQLGAPEVVARIAWLAVGATLLVMTWRRRSFALAVASTLALSPIVWLDYFALAAIPLATVRPRFSPVWLLPLVTWGAAGTGIGIGDAIDTARVLLVFAIVFAIAARAESRDFSARAPLEAVPARNSVTPVPREST